MEEIRGKYNTAISFAKVIEDAAREQIRRMCNYEFTRDSKIRIMPDVHAGKGCTIGTTMTVVDKAVPNIVGVDIGCGMYTVKLETDSLDFEKIDEAAHYIPSNKNVWDFRQERFDLQELNCYRSLKETRRLEKSLGTLGGGNHFIEIDRASDGTFYLVIHTGSRNLGKQVAEIYQRLAIDLACGKDKFFRQKEEIIAVYKSLGRKKEIQSKLKELEQEYRGRKASMPDDLCYVYGKYFHQYLHDMELCQEFARRNRELIAKILLGKAGISAGEAFHTIHNYIDVGELIIRKGAIAAHKDERVLIPINMRDGSVLAVGKGNADWNYSAPHGAGRLMSRGDAKTQLSMDDYKNSMAGVYSTSISEGTLDESPQAYKSLDDILDVIGDTVDILEVMKPVYNFKAEG
ncbi:MAG: RtcB family protein [Selenomonadaceae bacterium]|nr:RtcB family protein [Selenomonadaceae bacterium]